MPQYTKIRPKYINTLQGTPTSLWISSVAYYLVDFNYTQMYPEENKMILLWSQINYPWTTTIHQCSLHGWPGNKGAKN